MNTNELFEIYNEKVEYCQDFLDEMLTTYGKPNLNNLKVSGQIVEISDYDIVEFDIYIEDQVQTLWLPFTCFETGRYDEDGCSSLSFILFTFFEGVRRGLMLSSEM